MATSDKTDGRKTLDSDELSWTLYGLIYSDVSMYQVIKEFTSRGWQRNATAWNEVEISRDGVAELTLVDQKPILISGGLANADDALKEIVDRLDSAELSYSLDLFDGDDLVKSHQQLRPLALYAGKKKKKKHMILLATTTLTAISFLLAVVYPVIGWPCFMISGAAVPFAIGNFWINQSCLKTDDQGFTVRSHFHTQTVHWNHVASFTAATTNQVSCIFRRSAPTSSQSYESADKKPDNQFVLPDTYDWDSTVLAEVLNLYLANFAPAIRSNDTEPSTGPSTGTPTGPTVS